ncbi:MAG: 3-dehydroquinate synthase [Leptospiraceae bacterium]|nr:3-dehydroquinate synthase [Leptospiraceae bacterium]
MSTKSLEITTSEGQQYPVHISDQWDPQILTAALQPWQKRKIFIFSQENLWEVATRPILQAMGISAEQCTILNLGQGEQAKHIRNLEAHYDAMIRAGVDRHSLVLAIGGGVVGDYAGFVAATMLRGIAFMQFPSTLLAAVDSSVGGKVAVNAGLGKNMIGNFYQPHLVYCNTSAFAGLPDREWNCGLAEMAKHALLAPNGSMLESLLEHSQQLRVAGSPVLQDAILQSVAFKASVVAADVRERGQRAILNLGHTTAHALESLTQYRRYSHGEAVSRGLVTALLLSRQSKGLPAHRFEAALALLEGMQLPLSTDGFMADDVLQHMVYDKKNSDGQYHFVLLDEHGRAVYGCPVTAAEFRTAWAGQVALFG